MPNLFDSHAHLNDPTFDRDIIAVLGRASKNKVGKIVVVGYDIPSSIRAVELKERFKGIIYASCGVHPHDADNFGEEEKRRLRELLTKREFIAVGETGLDFYKGYSDRARQIDALVYHLRLAKEIDLPVILHTRNAFSEIFEIIEDHLPIRGVFHCFSGGEKEVERAIEMGFYISFSGSITFGSRKLEGAVRAVPIERLLVETDSPYLAPEPHRGERNEPSNLIFILEKIAKIRGERLNKLIEEVYNNTSKLFSVL